MLNEIEEFFSYVEVPQVLEHKLAFQETWSLPTGGPTRRILVQLVLWLTYTIRTDFVDTPRPEQLEHIRGLLDNLMSTDPDLRFSSARNVLYIAQGMCIAIASERSPTRSDPLDNSSPGTFASSTSPEHHLLLILSNAALLREAGALQRVWEAVKGTGLRWEGVSWVASSWPPSKSLLIGTDTQNHPRSRCTSLSDCLLSTRSARVSGRD